MAKEDEARWDERYAQGSHAQENPSAYLRASLEQLPAPASGAMAADLACGRGRNTRALAGRGYGVHGYDVSSVGLAAAAAATPPALAGRIAWHHRDLLASGLPPEARYDFVLLSRFVAPALLEGLHRHIEPGGWVCIEEHLAVPSGERDWQALVAAADWPDAGLRPAAVTGPGSARFRVAPGSLAGALGRHFEVLHTHEGLVADAKGEPALLAQLLARRTRD